MDIFSRAYFEIICEARIDRYREDLAQVFNELGYDDERKEKILNTIIAFNDSKKEKLALDWIKKKTLVLPEDLINFERAYTLAIDNNLNLSGLSSPQDVFNTVLGERELRGNRQARKIFSSTVKFDPDKCSSFKNKKVLWDGSSPQNPNDKVVIYNVDETEAGQRAVRAAMDSAFGDKEIWCLASRGYDMKGYWVKYHSYPKRVCFAFGKIIGFSALDDPRMVWWDTSDHAARSLNDLIHNPEAKNSLTPEQIAKVPNPLKDDQAFLMTYCKNPRESDFVPYTMSYAHPYGEHEKFGSASTNSSASRSVEPEEDEYALSHQFAKIITKLTGLRTIDNTYVKIAEGFPSIRSGCFFFQKLLPYRLFDLSKLSDEDKQYVLANSTWNNKLIRGSTVKVKGKDVQLNNKEHSNMTDIVLRLLKTEKAASRILLLTDNESAPVEERILEVPDEYMQTGANFNGHRFNYDLRLQKNLELIGRLSNTRSRSFQAILERAKTYPEAVWRALCTDVNKVIRMYVANIALANEVSGLDEIVRSTMPDAEEIIREVKQIKEQAQSQASAEASQGQEQTSAPEEAPVNTGIEFLQMSEDSMLDQIDRARRLSEQKWISFAKSNFDTVKIATAYKTPSVEALKILESSDNVAIRTAVAKNKYATDEILSMLAEDSSRRVKINVALNPNSSSETLKKLASGEHPDKQVLFAAAANPNCPSSVLVYLYSNFFKIDEVVYNSEFNDPSIFEKTWKRVLDNQNTPAYIKTSLTRYKDSSVIGKL